MSGESSSLERGSVAEATQAATEQGERPILARLRR